MELELAAFFQKKKIDTAALATAEPQLWAHICQEYALLGAAAYEQRKKFYLNDWRLRYPLATTEKG
ncbi:MAG: hypothetical protein LW884_01435 [Bacteroidetes bacterium]|jgi:hypothetical protein|nr:hypothetical protein [Bacteroidota bacterium]